jgi:hypothetical protein
MGICSLRNPVRRKRIGDEHGFEIGVYQMPAFGFHPEGLGWLAAGMLTCVGDAQNAVSVCAPEQK